MKKEIFKTALKGLMFGLFMIVWLSIGILWVRAWNWLKASKGDMLTYKKWNELVDKVNELESKIKNNWIENLKLSTFTITKGLYDGVNQKNIGKHKFCYINWFKWQPSWSNKALAAL